MIIDKQIVRNTLVVTTLNANKKVETTYLDMGENSKYWSICTADDYNVSNSFKNYNGEHVKQIRANNAEKQMRFSDIQYFLYNHAPTDVKEKMSAFSEINGYSIDIEIDVRNAKGFPHAHLAQYPILSISITSPTFVTVVMTLQPHDKIVIDDTLMQKIEKRINEIVLPTKYGSKFVSYYKYKHVVFNKEEDMLDAFLDFISKNHIYFGANFIDFDWKYIFNRCEILRKTDRRLDITRTSVTRTLSTRDNTPKHKLFFDIIEFFRSDRRYKDLQNYKLETISQELLEFGKLDFEGTYSDFINNDYENFLLYNAIDSILAQLLHKVGRHIYILAIQSIGAGVSIKEGTTITAQGDAHIWKKLYEQNKIFADKRTRREHEEYGGGLVTEPLKFRAYWLILHDFKALYPSLGRATGFSFENHNGNIKDFSKEELENIKKDKTKVISVNGNIYDISERGIVPRIWDELAMDRDKFKGYKKILYTKYIPALELEIKKRGLKK